MIEIKSLVSRNLEILAESHWLSLETLLFRRIKNSKTSKQVKLFLTKEIKNIITEKPSRLILIDRKLKKKFTKSYYESHLKESLNKIFNYNQFVSKGKHQSQSMAYDLAKKINLNTCPYCNRNYIVTVIKKSPKSTKHIVRPDFDHFFPQHKFPILALSFFNLIPCCSLCNRSVKGGKEMSLTKNIHPYIEGFDNAVSFNYTPKDVDSMLGISSNLTVSISEDLSDTTGKAKKAMNNVTDFKLKEIYSVSHTDEVADIIRKFHISGGRYLQILAKQFPQLGTVEELYKIAFANYYYAIDFEKRPLSKLTKDIFEQLKFTLPI